MSGIVFYPCAVICIISAILVVTRRNPIYSALFLILCFMSIAVIYLGLQAPFLAAMHVLVYTGAILVLFLFVIMLLNLRPPELGRELSPWIRVLIAILCVALFVMFCVPIIQGTKGYTIQPPPHGFGSVKGVGQTLFTYYLLPFELLSLVLLIAMIGGVILAKRRL